MPSFLSSSHLADRFSPPSGGVPRGPLFPRLALACLIAFAGCASTKPRLAPPPSQPEPKPPPTRAYSDQDAQEELGFGTVPTQRIHSRRRSSQHKAMPLHGAQTKPCAFDNCDISDEDDPL